MRNVFLLLLSLFAMSGFAQQVFLTDSTAVTLHFDSIDTPFRLPLKTHPEVVELECHRASNEGTLSDGAHLLTFALRQGDTLDVALTTPSGGDRGQLRLVGIEPNVRFTQAYIQANRGINRVDIPEVFELVNILLALHKDAVKDRNMFDTSTEYFREVEAHFSPFRNHPALDTIQKYMPAPLSLEGQADGIFPMPAYKYYYALKMNAAAYYFDDEGHIKHDGTVKEIGILWNDFDPMKDVALFEDFARKSGFRAFYKAHRAYYDELLATFAKLSPVDRMQQWLEKKFGFTYDSYKIFFSPLNKGAQAATQFEKDGFKQTYMFVCKSPVYPEYSQNMNELLSGWIVFTEIDHNYVNPVSTTLLPYIDRVFSNRDKWVKPGEIGNAYPDPYTVFNEYMTFGLYSLYALDHYPENEVNEFLKMIEPMMENVRGFIRYKDFNRALIERYRKKPDADMSALFQYMLYWAMHINDRNE